MEDSHIHDLPDCALEFCRAAGDTIPSFAQQKRPPLDSGGLLKRDQFLMWMARFWTFSAHSRTDSETVG